jgi:peptidoglycan hydrolase-like protein with peptidoglycan-binding domain
MKKIILEEIENMKYLLGYKRGVVISEQSQGEKDDLIDKYSSKSISNQIDLGNSANLDPKAAEAIKQAQNALGGQSVLTNPAAGSTTPTTGAPATGTPTTPAPAAATPATPIKIGVKYPSIEELQNTLNTKFQSGLTPDGKYGPKTAASVLAALQKVPTTNTNTTPVNTVVGGDASSEAIKKTAEANASTGVAANTTPSTSAQNAQPAAGGTNFTDVDNSEFS